MAMRRLALQGSVRRLFTRLHRWSGLTLLVLLAVAGATGGVLTFRDELERAVNPHLHVVAPGGRRVPLQDVISTVEHRYPTARVSTITVRSETEPDASLVVYIAKRPNTPPGDLPASEAFVDPYTGTVLGDRNRRHPIFSRANVVPMLIRLHYSLLLEAPGVWLMGGAAMVWLLTSVIGLALAWPTSWRRVGSWRPIVTVRRRDGPYKFTYDIHRAFGVALLPVWLVLAFTSVYLNFPGLIRAATASVTTVTAAATRAPVRVEPVVTPDQAIDAAVARVPGAKPFGVTRDFVRGWYSVRLIVPGDVNPSGNSQVYVDFSTGDVVATRMASALSAGDRFLFWQFPLHSGEAFGLPGRVAVTLAAVVLVVMCGTGLYVWWRGWSARRLRARRSMKEKE
jgi:uncharacterized iron-regulated membrane protein